VVTAAEKIVGITFVLPIILFRHLLRCHKQGNDICVVKNILHRQSYDFDEL